MTCLTCGGVAIKGRFLPFAHAERLPRGTRSHYVKPSRGPGHAYAGVYVSPLRAQRSAPVSPQTLSGAFELDPHAPAGRWLVPPTSHRRLVHTLGVPVKRIALIFATVTLLAMPGLASATQPIPTPTPIATPTPTPTPDSCGRGEGCLSPVPTDPCEAGPPAFDCGPFDTPRPGRTRPTLPPTDTADIGGPSAAEYVVFLLAAVAGGALLLTGMANRKRTR